MRIFITIFLFSIIITSCGQNGSVKSFIGDAKETSVIDSMPSTLTIVSKTIALDTLLSKDLKKCDDIQRQLNTLYGCIIKKGSKKYIREYTMIFDKDQQLDKLYNYTPMGADLISKEELFKDTALFNYYRLSFTNNIKFYNSQKIIVDNNDTLPIVDYWQKEKLIFVRNAKRLPEGRTVIYGCISVPSPPLTARRSARGGPG